MDLTPVLVEALAAWWWIAVVAVLIGLARLPVVKGYFGELLVRLTARLSLNRETYHQLDNLTLETRDGTTQIDHVIVSPFGVFVIETKSMGGWIFGGEREPQWTQKIFRKTFRFQNPLRQNCKHLKAVEEVLGVPSDTVYSVVVFMGDSRFKTPVPPNVTQGLGYIRYIKSFREPVFSEEQVRGLASRLESGRMRPSLETHRNHVTNLKKRADPTAERSCPACGSPMLIRNVRRGARAGQRFWGCSGYPKCRVTQEVG
jgi:restriction system protein